MDDVGSNYFDQEGDMSIPLTRSNLYRYLMNIIVEEDNLPAAAMETDRDHQVKIGSRELARQVIEDFSLAPESPRKQ